MHEMERLCENVRMELEKIGDKGLNASNIDTAYKLADILKDITTVKAMDEEGGYSSDYDRDNSYAMRGGRHYDMNRGRYSRDYSMERSGMDMADKLEDMMRDASPDDRRVLERFKSRLMGM